MAKPRTHHRDDCPTVKPGIISRWEEGCIICDSLDATDRRTRERMTQECFTHQDDLIRDLRRAVQAKPRDWITADFVLDLLNRMDDTVTDMPSEWSEDAVYDITYRTRIFDTPSGWYMKGGSSHVVGVDGNPIPTIRSITKVGDSSED